MDLWYELWDRAGSQGLDTWYDPRGARGEEKTSEDAGEATDVEPEGA